MAASPEKPHDPCPEAVSAGFQPPGWTPTQGAKMPTEIEMDLPDRFWKSRAETAEAEVKRLKAENEQLCRQNRELVTEIKIRDGVISDLQDRLAVTVDI
jgi:hypothetical protein